MNYKVFKSYNTHHPTKYYIEPFTQNKMNILGSKHNTDKVTHHGYHRFYGQFIDFISDIKNVGIIEIGMDKLSSLNMWLEYFPNAFIYGVDIGVEDQGDNYKIFKYDQSKISDLIKLKDNIKHKIYFINDDGSHIPEHQIISFNYLFKNVLENDGVYIIEDIETSYWTHNSIYGYETKYGYNHKNSLIERFKDIFDYINREYLSSENLNTLKSKLLDSNFDLDTLDMISYITICHNCIIIKKISNNNENTYYKRNYRFNSNI
jgi:hypothetical protein